MSERPALLEVRGLDVRFGAVHAVNDVSFTLPAGPYGLGLVGESGSGKTTTGRAVMRLAPIGNGSILHVDDNNATNTGRFYRVLTNP